MLFPLLIRYRFFRAHKLPQCVRRSILRNVEQVDEPQKKCERSDIHGLGLNRKRRVETPEALYIEIVSLGYQGYRFPHVFVAVAEKLPHSLRATCSMCFSD